MRLYRKTSSGHIAMRTGSEGPSHDPYSFREYEIERNDQTLVLHMGLGCWLEEDGKSTYKNGTEELLVLIFEGFSGLSLGHFEKALHHRRRMSRRERWEMDQMEAADAALLRYAL